MPELLPYPTTRADDVTDDYHGTIVADPYRWLEDLDAPGTEAWVGEQNAVSRAYLDALPEREAFRERLTQVWEYERRDVPVRRGERLFWLFDDGVRNQDVLQMADGLDAEPETLIDPNEWSTDGTAAMAASAISPDGRYIAYAVAEGGSDWQTWRVFDVEARAVLADELRHVKFTYAAWLPDGSGFFYGRYPRTTDNFEDSNVGQQVWFHRTGTSQDQDELIYERPDRPDLMLFPGVSDDGRWLIVVEAPGSSSQNGVALARLGDGPVRVRPWLDRFDAQYGVIDVDGDTMLVLTTNDAPRKRIVAIDVARPEPASWREILPQGEHQIEGASTVGDALIITRLVDATSQVEVLDRDGTPRTSVPLPGLGSVVGFGGRREQSDTFFAFTSFVHPTTIHRLDLATGTVERVFAPDVPFDPGAFVTEQVFVASKDGTRVPIFITRRADVEPTGDVPTILYGYGGFRNALVPAFSVGLIPWLERGGIFVSANIRGGGEYGEDWYKAGTVHQKQNCFDDFLAAAEWLIDTGYTNRDRLAIKGGSNGGLLVGACLTQRPDLFAAVHCAVGVLDMLRYHRFTIGWAWAADYGTADDPEEFKSLYAYSPLHSIRPGTEYPSIIITTGDHDDRVVPSHSFKFAATIQPAQAGPRPILLRVAVRAGHGLGKPKDKLIDEAADVNAFLWHELGA